MVVVTLMSFPPDALTYECVCGLDFSHTPGYVNINAAQQEENRLHPPQR